MGQGGKFYGVAQQKPGEHEGPALSLSKGVPSYLLTSVSWGLCLITAQALYAWHWLLYLAWDILTDRISKVVRRQLAQMLALAAGPPFQVGTSLVADCLEYAQYPIVGVGKRLGLLDAFCESGELKLIRKG